MYLERSIWHNFLEIISALKLMSEEGKKGTLEMEDLTRFKRNKSTFAPLFQQ